MSWAMSGGSIKFMTYNVWSCEHVAVYRRIQSICQIIERHDPDVIFLQEVTAHIHTIFQEAPWWATYKNFSSEGSYLLSTNPPSFCLLLSKLDAGEVVVPGVGKIPDDLLSAWVYTKGHRLRVATCRIPSLSPSHTGCLLRRDRASAFLKDLDAVHQHQHKHERRSIFVPDENVVLGGDLGWDDDLDGPLRLGDDGWVDAWLELRGRGGGGGEAGGWTYDADANPMLMRFNLPADRRRPDRFICKLRDFTLESIEMIGVDAIPGVTRLDDKGYPVRVLPSHHFGLLLTIKPKPN